jgi:serine/threonine-protein kinase
MKNLGKFEIIEKVGQGAMGVVYKARDPLINRIVALKTLTTGLAEDPNLLKRFYSEARSAGGLQHPNIVTIYELGHEGSTPFIAMQFLNGESLDKVVARRSNTLLSQTIGFIVYVCRGLDFAHKQRPPVIHRDIKPANVMVTTEGTVLVVDFGIARLGEAARSQSAGLLIGTLGYMSPQMFRNIPADARSDIWATGVMFYELLAHRRPFDGETAAALMTNIVLEKPRSLAEAAPGTPLEVQAVIERMLQKEVDARYQTMEEVLMDLEPIWRKLQQEDVSQLLANGQQIFEAGDLENARVKLSQLMQIDTSNTEAKSLLGRINAELRRKQIIPQIKSRVEKAERLLASGQPEDAKAEVEAALKLDSTFQPARDLLDQANAVIERARNVTQALRSSKQRMVEGALTEAELELDKVLELDPGNAAAHQQIKQLKEERSRRERRKQRDETLHRARTLWTNLQYDECIALLLEASKEFPGDTGILKLLESARQDQAEQQRQSQLAEIRNLLNSQMFDEALRALEPLMRQYPSDPTVESLRAHVLQGRDQKIREQRLAEGKYKLRTWVQQGKFEAALKYADQFSREFQDDFELSGLIEFARAEQAVIEQKRRLERSSKEIQQLLKDGRFSDAIVSAEKALLDFPKNIDLLILLDRAKKEKDEKEKHDLVKQRLREVDRLMERQDLTDAIDLARQTLATIGHDSRMSDALRKAEKEFEFREKKKRQQSETVQMAQAAIAAGKLSDATSILNGAIETQLLPSHDPRVTELLSQIKNRKAPSKVARPAASVAIEPTVLDASPISTEPSPDPGKTYVYQKGALLPEELVFPERDSTTSTFSPTIVAGPSTRSSAPTMPAVTPEESGKTATQKSRGEVSLSMQTASARQLVAEPAVVGISAEPFPQPAPRPLWKNPIAIGTLALMIAGGAAYAIFRPHPPPPPAGQPAEWDQAQQFLNISPRHLGDALAEYQSILDAGKDSYGAAKRKIDEIQRDQKLEKDWMEKAAAAQAAERYPEALKDFTEARKIDGDRASEAEGSIKVVNDLIAGKNPLEIAKENLTRADQLAVQKQWAQAVQAYQLVGSTKGLTADLRARFNAGLKIASANLEEGTLWARAQQSKLNGDSRNARALAERVVKLNLDHRDDARQLIGKVDLEMKGANEDQDYADLRRQTDAAKSASDEGALKTLQIRAQNMASGNGKHAAEAQQIAANEIPQLLDTLRKNGAARRVQDDIQRARSVIQGGASARFSEAMKLANDIGQAGGDPNDLRQEILSAESRALQDLQNEYNGANKKNESELKALQDRTLQFKSNANKPQDVDPLLSSIDKTIVAARTPTPPPNVSGDGSSAGGNPSGPVSSGADQDKIARLLDSYAQAFERKDQMQLRHVWPTLTDKQFKDNVDAFKGAESIHVTIQKNSITVNGITAVANCTQTTEVKTQGRVQRLSSTAIFSLRKLGMESGDWVVERVSFEKIR